MNKKTHTDDIHGDQVEFSRTTAFTATCNLNMFMRYKLRVRG